MTHFSRARRCTFTCVEETSTQVKVIFEQALAAEGLVDVIAPERLDLPTDDPRRPILLAVFDKGRR